MSEIGEDQEAEQSDQEQDLSKRKMSINQLASEAGIWRQSMQRIVLEDHGLKAYTQGIQQLLQAEKKAAEKVSEARKRKNRRLKQAKEEAQAEIEKYKADREKQFKEHEARHVGSRGDIAARIEADTKTKIAEMKTSVAAGQAGVITQLIDMVCEIKPEVHKNFR
eukprot:snap_masked-scaffold4150_size6548-processed-gene-0.0 protein:Tk04551 transcript:snap_masked-scaffold4150_size6548-processed-gene-0.0-mRNA-1 annotation:"vacuolar atpase g subunit-like protein"